MTTPHTPPAALPDVAAIEARTAAYESAARAYATADHGAAGRAACEAMHDTAHESAADIPALLAALRTLAAQHAADVAAAVAGERERIVARIWAHADECNAAAEDADGDGDDVECDAWRAARDEVVKLADAIAATGGGE